MASGTSHRDRPGRAARRPVALPLGLDRLPGFLGIGASGLLINAAALIALTEVARLHYLLSAVAATQVSTLWNFILHDRLVYRDRSGARPLRGRLGRYFLVNNLALLLRAPLIAGLVDGLQVHYVLANLASLIALTALRFLLAHLWIWPAGQRPAGAGAASHTYRIHDLLTVESDVPLPELYAFSVESLTTPPDVRIRIGHPTQPLGGASLEYRDRLPGLGFRLWIQRRDRFEIWASPLVALSPHVLYTNVVEPVLRWAFVGKDHALVHAAAVAFRGRAGLITSRTDTGKTTTVLRALESQSWDFLSDDMVLLSRQGRVLSYPKPMTISAHTLRAVRTARLRWAQRLTLPIQSRLHSRTGRRIGLWMARARLPAASLNAIVQALIPPPKYPIEVLLPGARTVQSAELTHLVLIQRGPEGEGPMDHQAIVQALLENADDAYGFPPYPALARFLSQSEGPDLRRAEARILADGTRRAAATRLGSENYQWWRQLPRIFLDPDRRGLAAPTNPTRRLPGDPAVRRTP